MTTHFSSLFLPPSLHSLLKNVAFLCFSPACEIILPFCTSLLPPCLEFASESLGNRLQVKLWSFLAKFNPTTSRRCFSLFVCAVLDWAGDNNPHKPTKAKSVLYAKLYNYTVSLGYAHLFFLCPIVLFVHVLLDMARLSANKIPASSAGEGGRSSHNFLSFGSKKVAKKKRRRTP